MFKKRTICCVDEFASKQEVGGVNKVIQEGCVLRKFVRRQPKFKMLQENNNLSYTMNLG